MAERNQRYFEDAGRGKRALLIGLNILPLALGAALFFLGFGTDILLLAAFIGIIAYDVSRTRTVGAFALLGGLVTVSAIAGDILGAFMYCWIVAGDILSWALGQGGAIIFACVTTLLFTIILVVRAIDCRKSATK